MARNSSVAGAQATAIQFSKLKGFPNQAPVLSGEVQFTPSQTVNERMEDVHSPFPVFTRKVIPGSLKMTFAANSDLSWLTGSTVIDANLSVSFADGGTLTATGVTLAGDPTEVSKTGGNTNERTFFFVSATET